MRLSGETPLRGMIKEHFDRVTRILTREIKKHYGDRLVSIAIFGSVVRGPMPHGSWTLQKKSLARNNFN